MHYVYFLRSESNSTKTYTGYTNNLERRLNEHNGDQQSGYTSRFKPWKIEAYVQTNTEETALVVERYFKNRSGTEKFKNFEEANPFYDNPKQGFLDTLKENRGFGRGENRFKTTKDRRNQTVFVMNTS